MAIKYKKTSVLAPITSIDKNSDLMSISVKSGANYDSKSLTISNIANNHDIADHSDGANWSSFYSVASGNYLNWNSTYSVVATNSASWMLGGGGGGISYDNVTIGLTDTNALYVKNNGITDSQVAIGLSANKITLGSLELSGGYIGSTSGIYVQSDNTNSPFYNIIYPSSKAGFESYRTVLLNCSTSAMFLVNQNHSGGIGSVLSVDVDEIKFAAKGTATSDDVSKVRFLPKMYDVSSSYDSNRSGYVNTYVKYSNFKRGAFCLIQSAAALSGDYQFDITDLSDQFPVGYVLEFANVKNYATSGQTPEFVITSNIPVGNGGSVIIMPTTGTGKKYYQIRSPITTTGEVYYARLIKIAPTIWLLCDAANQTGWVGDEWSAS